MTPGGTAGLGAEPAGLFVGELVALPAGSVGADKDRAGGAVAEVIVEGRTKAGRGRRGRSCRPCSDRENSVAVVVAAVAHIGVERFGDRRPLKDQRPTAVMSAGCMYM